MMYDYGYGPHFWFGDILSFVGTIIIIVLIISVIRRLVWGRRRGWGGCGPWTHDPWHGGSALNILRERYAKGEIDKQEFEEKKKDLEF